jgi:hypothetical protein
VATTDIAQLATNITDNDSCRVIQIAITRPSAKPAQKTDARMPGAD